MRIEFFLEERSAEVALRSILPKILSKDIEFGFHVFEGKRDLLKKLPKRLKGYRHWIPDDFRIMVLIDEDRQNCKKLKAELEKAAYDAGYVTKSNAPPNHSFQVVTRLAIEELEAWFIGDPDAIRDAYPKVSRSFHLRTNMRNPDHIPGGTSEALGRLLKQYYPKWLPKVEVAQNISVHMEPSRNSSRSFQVFVEGIKACVGEDNYK